MNFKINEKDKKLFDELNKDFQEIAEMISNSEVVSFDTPIEQSITFLSDYNTPDAIMYTSYFTDGIFKKIASKSICFTLMPINEKIQTYPKPLLLISDQSELDTNTKQIVSIRRARGLQTFPIIIFPDNFFQLIYGESSSYLSIIETYEETSGEKVIPFMESDIRLNSSYVSSYILYIACLIRIDLLLRLLEQVIEAKKNDTEKVFLSIKNEDYDTLKHMSCIIHWKAINQYLKNLNNFKQKLLEDEKNIYSELNVIRDNYDRHIDEVINGNIISDISSFALKIDLKYGKLAQYIKAFLNTIPHYNIALYNLYIDKVKKLSDSTLENISTNSVKISLIGTFSSGKTTLINTFLGEEKVLHTSAQHNTAVLMKLDYVKQKDLESCDFIYKNELKWSILKPSNKQTVFCNNTGYNIRILSIETNNSLYEVTYQAISSKNKKIWKDKFRKTGELAIKKGSVLKPGESFMKENVFSQANAKSTPASKSEIDLLIKILEKKECTKPLLKFSDNTQITDINKIVNILKKVHHIANEKNNVDIRFQDVLNVFSQNREFKEHALRHVTFEANINKKNISNTLNKENWEYIFGKLEKIVNKKSIKKVPFSELPECYMLIKELRLHIHSEFLQYCAVTDTPGFGSVTEEHDAITEHYIRDEPGRLLVMIAVNAKTEDGKYADLINNIENIYNNYRKEEKKDVIFILNCFSNIAHIENLKNTVNKVIKSLTQKGFNKKNVFVCDMKKAITKNERPKEMLGYPSYQAFHDFCVNDIITTDLNKRYNKIYKNWLQFFKDTLSDLEAKIFQYQSNLLNAEQRKEELNRHLSIIINIQVDNDILEECFNEIKDIFQNIYDSLISIYRYTRKGFFVDVRLNELNEYLKTVPAMIEECNSYVRDTIKMVYNRLINKLDSYNINSSDKPLLHNFNQPLVVLTDEKLKNLLKEADTETHWYNKSEQVEYYSSQILGLIQEDYTTSCERVRIYDLECQEKFINYKKIVVLSLEQELNSLDSIEQIKQDIENFEITKEHFQNMEYEFKRIDFFCK